MPRGSKMRVWKNSSIGLPDTTSMTRANVSGSGQSDLLGERDSFGDHALKTNARHGVEHGRLSPPPRM